LGGYPVKVFSKELTMISKMKFKTLCFIEKYALRALYLSLALVIISLVCALLFFWQLLTKEALITNAVLGVSFVLVTTIYATLMYIVKDCEDEMNVRYNRLHFHASRLHVGFADLLRSEALGENNLTIKPPSDY
jgi:hypothetical protein